jgi:leucine dehydrogenase
MNWKTVSLFEHPEFSQHEQVSYFSDEATGLRSIIAIHSTRGNVAGGGIRFFPYKNSADALYDVLRLSKAMSYKSALAGLSFGGGKSVIIGDPKVLKTEALLEAFGRCVERMGGKYICAEDIGMTPSDMAVISHITPYVTGLPGKSGDTSPLTGYGVYRALLAAADRKLGRKLESVAILGFGNVGRNLAIHLIRDKVRIYVADINQGNVTQAVGEFGATAVTTDDLFGLAVDALAPCSIGAVLNSTTIPRIKARIICGGANNQLEDTDAHGRLLGDMGVLFVPDYIANAGGLISGSAELTGRSEQDTLRMVEGIYDTCMKVFSIADETSCTPLKAAERLAEKILGATTAALPVK